MIVIFSVPLCRIAEMSYDFYFTLSSQKTTITNYRPMGRLVFTYISLYRNTRPEGKTKIYGKQTHYISLEHWNPSHTQITSFNFGQVFLHSRTVSLLFIYKSLINPQSDHEKH